MTFTKDAVTITGGCNCRAFRYKVEVPPYDQRAEIPYYEAGYSPRDVRLPITFLDHCNDCRRASGALLPMGMITELATVSLSCLLRTSAEALEPPYEPAAHVLDNPDVLERTYIAEYQNKPGRYRWFCSRCGTHLGYMLDAALAAKVWPDSPRMMDIWLGTVDREHLEQEWIKPERIFWCDYKIQWISDLARDGAGGLPEHPEWKINEVDEVRKSF
ncbi:hypothetical protein H2203_002733 [Taxawa tesnikishii (nom. ined.)]|nr:hypothetical protein H2203_002733 [Dothideales sp. JES 119]